MKTAHKLILIFFIIIFLSHAHAVHANATRYGDALLTTNSSSWDSNQIKMPAVIYDKSLYKMLYGGQGTNGRWQIGLAYSLDGINWIKFINPVKSRLTYDGRDVHDPSWLFNSLTNKYEMWYTSSTNSGSTDLKIYHSESNDGINWTNDQDVMVHKPEAAWEIEMVSCPNVLLINNKYYMWLAGRNGTWKIGVFTSTDGITWIPNLSNPIITRTYNLEAPNLISPEIYYDTNNIERKFNMFYTTTDLGAFSAVLYAYSPDGIDWIKPLDENPIIIKSSISPSFDKNGVSESSVVKTSESTFIWYGGHYLASKGIGLAYLGLPPTLLPTPSESLFPTSTPLPTMTPTPEPTVTPTLTPTPSPSPKPTSSPTPSPSPSPTPSPTPKPSPTPSPSPTPTPLPPIVIIPGMFSSWNKEEMLENKHTTNAEWKLLGFVKEYDGIIKTLKNLGYQENENLFIWTYDWRKPVADIASQFNIYLANNVLNKPGVTTINLVGHSLGGLVARTWTQTENNKNRVKHLITLGSPHQGAVQPYNAWEGGDASQGNTVLSFATQILLQINKKSFQTNREAIQQTFPVLKDLLPSQPYLIRKSDNSTITKNQMYVWNTWQEILNNSIQTIYPTFDAIAGTGTDTPNKYIVVQPSKIDFLLGNWQDGKPDSTITAPGDNTVNTSRSIFSDDPSYVFNKNHGELIASKEGIQNILDLLSIDYASNQINEGKTTTFAPGLLFLLQSPATILVSYNGQEYYDQDGILYIPDAQEGTYTTTITGTGNGEYHLSIGQFGINTTLWSSLTNSIQQNEKQNYSVVFHPTDPDSMPITNLSTIDWITQIEQNLQILESYIDKQKIRRVQIELALAKRMLDKQNYFVFKIQTEILLRTIAEIREKTSNEGFHLLFDTEDLIGQMYISALHDKPHLFSDRMLKTEENILDKEVIRLENKLAKKKSFIIQDLLFIQRGFNIFDLGKTKLITNNLPEASFFFALAQTLLNIQ